MNKPKTFTIPQPPKSEQIKYRQKGWDRPAMDFKKDDELATFVIFS